MPSTTSISSLSSTTGIDGLSSSDPIAVREWLLRSSNKKQLTIVDKFLIELRRGNMVSKTTTTGTSDSQHQSMSLQVVQKVVNVLRHMIGSTNWKTSAELLYLIKGLGREIHANNSQYNVVAVDNVIRRIMAVIRDETDASYSEEMKVAGTGTISSTTPSSAGRLSLETMLWALPQHIQQKSVTTNISTSSRSINVDIQEEKKDVDGMNETMFPQHYYTLRPDWKQVIMEAIQELITDLEDMHKSINDQSTNYIHSGEVILTVGHSKTIELFLKSAAKHKRTFHVIMVMTGSGTNGTPYEEMAKSISEANAMIETTIINESAIFAVMARVHKVLLPARAVLANGGLVSSIAGCNLVALAAQHHSVPVHCITGLFKLCPRFPHEGQDTYNELLNGQYDDDDNNNNDDRYVDNVECVNPAYDYIEPKYIHLYITNVGSFQPSFTYRMLAENYHTDDWDSFE